MKLLVLGGTLFLGRHVVEEAVERGHDVTLFNRGRTNPGLYPEIEHLAGDRDGDLSALGTGRWDAVVDTSARLPRWVRDSAELVADSVEHYTFVSSCSAYADMSRPGVDESAPVHQPTDETVEEMADAETYGALKALCERAAESAMPGRVLAVRAGVIVGPYDDSGRFTYWVHRLAQGGDVLAPEPREQPVELVDARDLAAWILELAGKGRAGVFNATGPAGPLTMEAMLDKCKASTGTDARLCWVDGRFLVDAGVEAWSDLPLWLGTDPAFQGFLSVDVSKAVAAGLQFRPLPETVRDTLAGAEPTPGAGLAPEREAELLQAWRERA